MDAQAQTDIVTSKYFVDFIYLAKSICLINDIFTKTEQQEMAKELEPSRPVHKPWQEVDPENNIQWEPKESDKYVMPRHISPFWCKGGSTVEGTQNRA